MPGPRTSKREWQDQSAGHGCHHLCLGPELLVSVRSLELGFRWTISHASIGKLKSTSRPKAPITGSGSRRDIVATAHREATGGPGPGGTA